MGAAKRLDFDDSGGRRHHDRHSARGREVSCPARDRWDAWDCFSCSAARGAGGRRRTSCTSDAAVTFAITSVAFLTAVFGFAALRVDRFQNAKPMMAAICADETKRGQESFPSHPSIADRHLSLLPREHRVLRRQAGDEMRQRRGHAAASAQQALAQFLAKPGRSYVITTDEYEPEIEEGVSRPAESDPPRAAFSGGRRDGDLSPRRLTPSSRFAPEYMRPPTRLLPERFAPHFVKLRANPKTLGPMVQVIEIERVSIQLQQGHSIGSINHPARQQLVQNQIFTREDRDFDVESRQRGRQCVETVPFR